MKKIIPIDAILIPDHASRVFKGDIYDVYQWPQAMFDGSTKTFEMLKRPDTVLIVGIVNDKIVMIDDEQPGRKLVRQFPGGRVDEDDISWLDAAKREMLEETGYSFNSWKLLTVSQTERKIERFLCIFIATNVADQQDQQLESGGEKISVHLVDYQNVRNKALGGEDQELNLLLPFFLQAQNVDTFIRLPEFIGQEVSR